MPKPNFHCFHQATVWRAERANISAKQVSIRLNNMLFPRVSYLGQLHSLLDIVSAKPNLPLNKVVRHSITRLRKLPRCCSYLQLATYKTWKIGEDYSDDYNEAKRFSPSAFLEKRSLVFLFLVCDWKLWTTAWEHRQTLASKRRSFHPDTNFRLGDIVVRREIVCWHLSLALVTDLPESATPVHWSMPDDESAFFVPDASMQSEEKMWVMPILRIHSRDSRVFECSAFKSRILQTNWDIETKQKRVLLGFRFSAASAFLVKILYFSCGRSGRCLFRIWM